LARLALGRVKGVTPIQCADLLLAIVTVSRQPLYYALHYASELLGTTVPDPVMAEESRVGRPPATVRVAMDPMVRRALLRDLFESRTPWSRVAPLMPLHSVALAAHAAAAFGAAPAAQGVGPKFCRGLLSPAVQRARL
jgi:hypothetical protein